MAFAKQRVIVGYDDSAGHGVTLLDQAWFTACTLAPQTRIACWPVLKLTTVAQGRCP
jgi:hypothetical protein